MFQRHIVTLRYNSHKSQLFQKDRFGKKIQIQIKRKAQSFTIYYYDIHAIVSIGLLIIIMIIIITKNQKFPYL